MPRTCAKLALALVLGVWPAAAHPEPARTFKVSWGALPEGWTVEDHRHGFSSPDPRPTVELPAAGGEWVASVGRKLVVGWREPIRPVGFLSGVAVTVAPVPPAAHPERWASAAAADAVVGRSRLTGREGPFLDGRYRAWRAFLRADHGTYDSSLGDPRAAAVHGWAEQAYFELDAEGPVWVALETHASSVSVTSALSEAGIQAVPPLLEKGVRVRETLRFEPVAAATPWTSVVGGGPSGLAKVAAAAAALVGAALAVLGGGLAAARLLRPRGGRPATVGYVLQLDRDHLTLEREGSARVVATPWRVLADGRQVPAPEARLQLSLPLDARGWVASPVTGSGALACTIGVHGPQPAPRVELTVTACAGASTVSATVVAEIACPLAIEMQPDPLAVPVGDPVGAWAWARVSGSGSPDLPSPDQLTAALAFGVMGSGSSRVALDSAPGLRDGWRAVNVTAAPAVGVPPDEPRLQASVTAGPHRLSASIELQLGPGFVLQARVDGSPTAEARLEAGRWALPPVEVWFADQDGRPVRPPAGARAPELSASPAAVQASGPAATRDGVLWTIPVRDCPDEIAALLRAGGGDVRVSVAVGDDSGRIHRASVAYLVPSDCRLRLEPPSVELRLDGSASLEVSLVRPAGHGPAELVPAALAVEPPQGTGVGIAPLRGRDLLRCELRIDDPERASSFLLPVRAQPPGRPALEGLVSVVVELPYEVAIVRGPDLARVVGAWTVDPAGLVVPAVALDTSSEPPRAEPLLAPRIAFELRGPNARLLKLAPGAADAQARVSVTFAGPAPGEAFEPGDPQLVATLRLGGRTREHAVSLALARCRQQVLEGAIREIAAELAARGHFVRNRLQGTPILDGAYQAYAAAWGAFSGQAITCEGYVAASEAALLAAVRRCYGDQAGLEQMTFIEKSTVVGAGLRDWCDAWYDDNHTLFRLTLPDGTQQAVDFWEQARKLIPDHPVVNDWQGVEAIWKRRLGADFDPAYSVTTHRVIQAGCARPVPAAVRP